LLKLQKIKRNESNCSAYKKPGNKNQTGSWIMELAPKVKGKWIEPFLGTGVVAFNSGFKKAILEVQKQSFSIQK